MTPNTHPPLDPKDAVLKQIRAGAVHMRPRFYFVLKAAAVGCVAALILVLSVFLGSFILFALRTNGADSLLGFGSRGFVTFLQLFPWPLALLDLGLVMLFESLLRYFRFAYSRSVLYVLIGAVVIVGAVSVAVARGTQFHENLLEHADREELPQPLDAFYKNTQQKSPEALGVFRGEVITVHEDSFVITNDDGDEDEDDGTWEVSFPDDFDEEEIEVGDKVFVAGDHDDERVEAYGIKVLRKEHREDD